MRIERRAGLSQEMLEERVTKETAVLKLDAGISRSDVASDVAFSEDLFRDLAAGYFGPFMDDRELNALLPLETVESTLPGNIGSKQTILEDNLTSKHVEDMKETATIVELLLLLKTSHKTDAPYTTFKEIMGRIKERQTMHLVHSSRIHAIGNIVSIWLFPESSELDQVNFSSPNDISDGFIRNFYILSNLFHRLRLLKKGSSRWEKLKYEYDLLMYPVEIPTHLYFLNSDFVPDSAVLLHICHTTLLLCYYNSFMGLAGLGIEPLLALLRVFRAIVESISEILLSRREALMDWSMCQYALKVAVETAVHGVNEYASEDMMTSLRKFLALSEKTMDERKALFPNLPQLREMARRCPEMTIHDSSETHSDTVYWMFRDIRIMSITGILRFGHEKAYANDHI